MWKMLQDNKVHKYYQGRSVLEFLNITPLSSVTFNCFWSIHVVLYLTSTQLPRKYNAWCFDITVSESLHTGLKQTSVWKYLLNKWMTYKLVGRMLTTYRVNYQCKGGNDGLKQQFRKRGITMGWMREMEPESWLDRGPTHPGMWVEGLAGWVLARESGLGLM